MTSLRVQGLRLLLSIGLAFALWIFVSFTQNPDQRSAFEGVPVDPTIYRFYELIQVYGPTIKALIHEEFGDGIMSAIDFDMEIKRKEDPKGDRVVVTLNGKFLPYKKF